nr:hypothetical protein [uncultured Acetatifactor sp.]
MLMVFREHSGMVLREEHIVCFQVNWGNKPDNIGKIAETLGIGLESIVFVDDSPLEIQAVRAILPEVAAIPYHRERMYGQFRCFNLRRGYERGELGQRNETYRTNRHRQQLREESGSYSGYLASLGMEIGIHEAVPLEHARIAELSQRTNRCTNGKRYSVTDIGLNMERSGTKIYSVYLKDRYSDLGLIGAMEMTGDRLTLFSVSCRALGREIERHMIGDFLSAIKGYMLKAMDENEQVNLKPLYIMRCFDAVMKIRAEMLHIEDSAFLEEMNEACRCSSNLLNIIMRYNMTGRGNRAYVAERFHRLMALETDIVEKLVDILRTIA